MFNFIKNIKIRTKLIVAPLIFFAIAGLIGLFGYQVSKNILISEIETSSLVQAQSIMNAVDILMHRNIHTIESMADDKIFTDEVYTAAEISAYLESKLKFYHFVDSFSYFDINRIRIADTDDIGIGKQHPMEGFWHDIYQGKNSVGSDVRIGPERQTPIIYFAAPVKSREAGQIIGALVARFSTQEISTMLMMVTNTESSHSTLFTKDRDVLFSNCPHYKDKILKEKITTDLPFVGRVLNKEDGVIRGYDNIHNFNAINAYVYEKGFEDFQGNNWSLVITTNENVALKQIDVLGKIAFGMALFTAFLALAMMFLLSYLISKPIAGLSQTVQDISKGDLTKRAEIKSKDEIGQLAASFNQMTESLIATRKFPENIIRSMGDSLIVVSPEAKIKEVNQATLDLLGYQRKELLGQPIEKVFGRAAAAAAADSIFKGAGLEKLIKDGFVKDVEMNYQNKKGNGIPVLVSGSVMKDEKGKMIGIVVVAKDIREIQKLQKERERVAAAAAAAAAEKSKRELYEKMAKELEQKVKERTVNLDAANQQLRATNQQLNAANQQLSAAQKNLQDKLLELERFNKVAVGRELKMVELKEEIARLKGTNEKKS